MSVTGASILELQTHYGAVRGCHECKGIQPFPNDLEEVRWTKE